MPREDRDSPPKEFPEGFFVSWPRKGAPSFVKARVSIRISEFLPYLAAKDDAGEEWLRVDVKESSHKVDDDGRPKLYAQTDTWQKPEPKKDDDNALPF